MVLLLLGHRIFFFTARLWQNSLLRLQRIWVLEVTAYRFLSSLIILLIKFRLVWHSTYMFLPFCFSKSSILLLTLSMFHSIVMSTFVNLRNCLVRLLNKQIASHALILFGYRKMRTVMTLYIFNFVNIKLCFMDNCLWFLIDRVCCLLIFLVT